MGNMYRILIEGGDGETVADLTAPVETLAQFAPEAVARLLREATPESEGDAPVAPRFTDAEPVRRKRRTKAEMEAARSAEGQDDVQRNQAGPDPEPTPETETRAYNPFGPK